MTAVLTIPSWNKTKSKDFLILVVVINWLNYSYFVVVVVVVLLCLFFFLNKSMLCLLCALLFNTTGVCVQSLLILAQVITENLDYLQWPQNIIFIYISLCIVVCQQDQWHDDKGAWQWYSFNNNCVIHQK